MKEYSEEEMQRVSRAFGCVIGAFVGDALGAYLEMRKEVTDKLVEEALQMNGGGPLKTGPGQITDDSEMAMCLLHSLNCFQEKAYDEDKDCGLDQLKVDPDLVFDLTEIQKQFCYWKDSEPFDIGQNTHIALSVIKQTALNP